MITLPRAQLAAELTLLGPAIETKGTMPILAFVRIVFDGTAAHLTGTSIDVTVETQVAGTGEPWSGCLPWKQLAALVKALDAEQVTISNKGDDRCEVRAGRSKTTLPMLSIDGFPNPDKQQGETVGFDISGALLRDGLRRVLPCVTNEESRYNMAGVQFESDGEALRLVATDGARLGVATLPDVSVTVKALVPPEGLRALLVLESETIAVELSGNLAAFRSDHRTITARLAAGTFPNWQLIMPANLPHRMELDGEQLSAALKRAAITRGETSRTGAGLVRDGVRLSLASDSLAVIVDENDRGAFDEAIDATSNLNGENVETRFNPDFIGDFLATHEGKMVCEWQNSLSGFLFTWPEVAFQYVVMPMRV